MTEIERLTQQEFIASQEYQGWLATHKDPPGVTWVDSVDSMWHTPQHTARGWARTRWDTRLHLWLWHTLAVADRCVDVGSGEAPFRQRGAWGVDPEWPQHRHEELTQAWWHSNRGQWPRAMAINSLHFGPIDTVRENLCLFQGLLMPQGRSVAAINRQRVGEIDPGYTDRRMEAMIQGLPGVARVMWFTQPRDDGMDGNLWIWFRADR
jgi:hypothetical protein